MHIGYVITGDILLSPQRLWFLCGGSGFLVPTALRITSHIALFLVVRMPYVQVHEFPSASSVFFFFDDALDVVGGTRECYEAKRKPRFSTEVQVNEWIETYRFL